MVPNYNPLPAYPPELITRVVDQAARDADLTAHFLRAVGLAPHPGKATRLPSDFLLELAAAMRLLAWEEGGMDPGAAEFPSARDAILSVLEEATLRLIDAMPRAVSFSREVFGFTLERMAWSGPGDLGAEILLDFPGEDALIEAMARFLWDHRAATPGNTGGSGR